MPALNPTLGVLRKAAGRPYFERVNAIVRLVTYPGIDLTTGGPIDLMLVPTGVNIVITEVVVLCTAAANVSAPATAGVGIASGEDDIFPSQQLTGLLVASDVFRFAIGGAGVIAQSGQIVKLGIDAPATGTSVSQTVQVELFGYRG